MKKLSFLVAALCATTMAATAATVDQVYKTALFGSKNNSEAVNDYISTWTSTNDEFTVSIANFNNNNNGWNGSIKCGSKKFTSVATITTQAAIDQAITKVVITFGTVTAANLNSAKLIVASNDEFTENKQEIDITVKKGEVACAVTTPTENMFYKLTFDCKKASGNGFIEISKIEYYVTVPPTNATEVALSETALELDQYKYVTLTATPTPADATDAWTWASDNTDVATVTQNGKVTIVAATGTANITVTSQTTPTVTATCAITAKAATPITCAEAAAKAEAVSANNEIAAGGMYVIRGYVTEIAYAYSASSENMSVWMADAADGGKVFEAYKVVPVDAAAQGAGVGDYVEVVGDITKYNTTYETAAGGSLKIITKATPTALDQVELSGIYANGGTIEGIGAAGRIFTVSGMEVTSQNGALTSGIYIVKLGDKTQKIAIK